MPKTRKFRSRNKRKQRDRRRTRRTRRMKGGALSQLFPCPYPAKMTTMMPTSFYSSRTKKQSISFVKEVAKLLGVNGYTWDRKELISGKPHPLGTVVGSPDSLSQLSDAEKEFDYEDNDQPIYLAVATCSNNSSSYAKFVKKKKNQRVQIGPSSKLEIHNVNLADIKTNKYGDQRLPDYYVSHQSPGMHAYAGRTFTGRIHEKVKNPFYPGKVNVKATVEGQIYEYDKNEPASSVKETK